MVENYFKRINAYVMPLYKEIFTVWCPLWSKDVIGSYFFENHDGTTVTVNSEVYGHMISYFFCLLKNTTWFQQDGACHTTTVNMALLQETFPGV